MSKHSQQMINVGGLHRSGTTLAQFILGSHPDCMAFGEIDDHFRKYIPDTNCSCGKPANECSFWRNVSNLDEFNAQVKALGVIPVTSDKQQPATFSMIRDVRGWALSCGRQSIKGYLFWWKYYKDRENLQSYEELSLQPEQAIERMCRFAGLSVELDAMMRYGLGEHHAIKCNRMSGDPSKMGKIIYDARWMAENSLLPTLLPPVMVLNRRAVYAGLE